MLKLVLVGSFFECLQGFGGRTCSKKAFLVVSKKDIVNVGYEQHVYYSISRGNEAEVKILSWRPKNEIDLKK